MNNDKIVTAIINDANAYADGVKTKANRDADKILTDAKNQADAYIANKKQEAEKDAQAVIDNKRTLIRLDENKVALGARRKALDEVYKKAITALENADAKTYLSVIAKMIEKHAENGEEVIVAKNAPVSESDVSSLTAVKDKKLTVKGGGDFSGGVLLKGKGYEKSLTFSALIESLRQETEMEISQKLFKL